MMPNSVVCNDISTVTLTKETGCPLASFTEPNAGDPARGDLVALRRATAQNSATSAIDFVRSIVGCRWVSTKGLAPARAASSA